MKRMKVLVANRGEVACRILRTLQELGIASVAVYTTIDANAPHVWLADDAVPLGESLAYLDGGAVIAAARQSGATAVHPGYGFLSQNAGFARACGQAGVAFIGPSPEAMATLGDKRAARAVAEAVGVPVVPGATACDTVEAALAAAQRVGFPVLIKAAGGGGGKGMRQVPDASALPAAFAAAQREAAGAFGDDRLLVEKYIFPARHIEVQIMGDGRRALALGERECSLQRRYQKIVEECPAPQADATLRQHLWAAAVQIAEAVGYLGAGTVEFLLAPDGRHYFLEVNTRLQVEHPVTEAVTGIDIVAAQIALACGGGLPPPPGFRGHAIEARLNAEDPSNGFLPAVGRVSLLRWPERPWVRVDAGIAQGSEITPHYDSLLAKIIAWGNDREMARRRLIQALRETTVLGVATNQAFLLELLNRQFFIDQATFTTTVEDETWHKPEVPSAAREAVRVYREQKGRRRAGDGEHAVEGGDIFSPWERLGAFRMGVCG